MNVFYKINAEDNVATALIMDEAAICNSCDTPPEKFLEAGVPYPLFEEGKGEIGTLTPNKTIASNTKVAITAILKDKNIIKFNAPIGYASQDIAVGDVVHVCNVVLENEKVKELLEPFMSTNKNSMAEADHTIQPKESLKITDIKITDKRLGKQMKDTFTKDVHLGIACSVIPEGASIRIGNMIDIKKLILDKEKNNKSLQRRRETILNFYRFLNNDLGLNDLKG